MKLRLTVGVVLFSFALVVLSQSQTPQQSRNASTPRSEPAPTPTRASPGVSMFYLLAIGNSDKSAKYWPDALRDTTITEAEIKILQTYAANAVAGNMAFQHKEQDKVCAGKDKLTTLDTVAMALTQFDLSNTANMEQLGNAAAKTLGDRLGELLKAAGGRSTSLVSETDHKKVITTKKRDPIEVIQKFCSRSDSSRAA